MSVNLTPYKIVPNSTTIEYKKVPQSYYRHGQFEFQQGTVRLEPNEGGYIVEDLLEKLDYDRSDTTIVNIGVGQGKTTTAYKLVDHYAKHGKYVVIVVSPYKKLVKRDYDKLSKDYNVSHYEMSGDENEDSREIAKRDVHIITINTLLLNPGEGNLQMKDAKRNYINGITDYCKENNKQVVFIFDEIHAGIHTYEQKFIFNLLRWKKLTHKCFVLSATFTEASMVATEFIGRLTNDRFKIFEAPRHKLPEQADLHLYVTAEDYSGLDQTLLNPLADIIEEEAKGGKKVHIITAYKDLARRIADKKSKYRLAMAVNKHLDCQLLTGDEKDEFDKSKSHVGTTFSTGVSLDSGKDTLVIIMPSGRSKEDATNRNGGIFTDGTVPIIQAVARLRGKGNIYIFVPIDKALIQPTYKATVGEPVKFLEKHFTGIIQPRSYDEQLGILEEFYDNQTKDIKDEIECLNWKIQ